MERKAEAEMVVMEKIRAGAGNTNPESKRGGCARILFSFFFPIVPLISNAGSQFRTCVLLVPTECGHVLSPTPRCKKIARDDYLLPLLPLSNHSWKRNQSWLPENWLI